MNEFIQLLIEHLDLLLFVALLAGPGLVLHHREFNRGS